MHIRSLEHLYQAMRFTHEVDLQGTFSQGRIPMESKRIARQWEACTRSDWMDIRLNAMRWSLRIELAQHMTRSWIAAEVGGISTELLDDFIAHEDAERPVGDAKT